MTADNDVSKPAKVRVEGRVGDSDNQIARRLAEKKGVAIADIWSQAIERGLPILVEEDNKVNWWEQSTAKTEFLKLLATIPEDQMEQAIRLLQGLGNE